MQIISAAMRAQKGVFPKEGAAYNVWKVHWRATECLLTLATLAKLGKPYAQTVHPISVLFTPQQLAWLDGRRSPGLSRSAVIRLVVEEAMRKDQRSTGKR